MIVILGATGTIGNTLVRRLSALGLPTRALSREPDKLRARLSDLDMTNIEIRTADAYDSESMLRALQGAEQLFLALSNCPDQVALETSIIQIAVQAGIKHIFKISSPIYDPRSPVTVASWHGEIELVLAESGLTYTILRPYAFMQNLLRLTPTISTQDTFFGCIGDAPCNFVDSRDIADVAAAALTDPEVAGRIYTLTGARTFTYPEIAEHLSSLLQRPIQFIHLPPEILRSDLIEHGHMPSWLADHVVEIQTMSAVINEQPTDTVERILGREPRRLEAFLQEHIGYFQPRL
ncbi:SDR family oxidoreductase [Paenibacillus sp. N1-5-1-14]|uniref:SDR family oxidoreductase n=1 Tax=Paenibacillus radicibacter TaxID=2972488 RepID=UPI002158E2BA|nr:SDR family oxidoreductase [Paenibacillus radicibacter]MCR8645410.1 SDR family oxidoreductase [Paenibacillus radicibacter]